MIVKEAKYTPLYQQLGLFTEAPRRKRRPRVITVRASRARDYTDDIEPEEDIDVGNEDNDYEDVELDEPDDDGGDTGDENNDTDTGADNADGGGEATNDDNTDDNNNDAGEGDTNQEDTDGGGNGDDNDNTAEDDGDENIDIGGDDGGGDGDEDYSDGADGNADDGNDGNDEEGNDGDDNGDDDGGGNEEKFNKNDMRKFKLFERFEQIHKTLTFLISKMESIISDDIVIAEANNHALKSFTRLAAVAKDYMVLKFRSDSYPQNKYMYERLRAATLLTVESLNIRKNEKSK